MCGYNIKVGDKEIVSVVDVENLIADVLSIRKQKRSDMEFYRLSMDSDRGAGIKTSLSVLQKSDLAQESGKKYEKHKYGTQFRGSFATIAIILRTASRFGGLSRTIACSFGIKTVVTCFKLF